MDTILCYMFFMVYLSLNVAVIFVMFSAAKNKMPMNRCTPVNTLNPFTFSLHQGVVSVSYRSQPVRPRAPVRFPAPHDV